MRRVSSSLTLSLILLLLHELAPLSRALVVTLGEEFDEVDSLQEDATEAIIFSAQVICLVR